MGTNYKALLISKLFIFALICLSACERIPRLPPLASDAVILAFGDSLTYGTGAESNESYPVELQRMIGRKIINKGVPGELSAEGLRRLPGVLDEVKPQLLILCHGGNDLLRKTGEAATADNLRAMIKIAKERGIGVVMIAVPKPGFSLSPPEYYESVAKENGIPIEVNILSVVLKDNGLKSDLIHPNAKGYALLANAIARLLEKAKAI